MKWEKFENDVADIFRLFGYTVVQNTKIEAAQTDSIATTNNKFKPRILIECKYHSVPDKKVSIDEVENFAARVLKLRTGGKIEMGYLVTNTDFTSAAKESISDQAQYIFLSRYDELIHHMIDVDYYLKTYVEEYRRKQLRHYVDLRLVDIRNLDEIEFTYAIKLKELQTATLLKVGQFGDKMADGTESRINEPIFKLLVYLQGELKRKRLSFSPFKRTLRGVPIREIIGISRQGRYFGGLTEDEEDFITNKIASFQTHDTSLEGFGAYCEAFLQSTKNFFILLGDFGSGKTSSVQNLMYRLSKLKLDNPYNPEIPIPLLLTLRNYNKVPDIDSLFINFFQTEIGYSNINLQVFKKMNESGQFILLLDGFDEMAKLVTESERRLTFAEICKLITPKNKLIVTSRPGYFPENQELSQLLKKYVPNPTNTFDRWCNISVPANCQIGCLQLMDKEKSEEYIEKNFPERRDEVQKLITDPSLRDLAGRPVLLNMISESYDELRNMPLGSITLGVLYEIYTNKWINREEDKGRFRILMDPKKKIAFLSLLAIQMNKQDKYSIHFSVLDTMIQRHFKIDNQESVDHFSHDIRTCSFLNRDDVGNYSFIHKSFMEYFIVKEFFNYRSPIYKGEMEFALRSPEIFFRFSTPDAALDKFAKLSSEISSLKDLVIKAQRFDYAGTPKDIEIRAFGGLVKMWPHFESIDSMLNEFRIEINTIRERILGDVFLG